LEIQILKRIKMNIF